MKRLALVIILVVTILSLGCSSSRYEMRMLSDNQWIEDIDFLDNNLREHHPDIFKFISEEKWDESIEMLKSDVSQLSDTSIKLRIAQIISSIGDAHTSMLSSELLSPIPSNIEKGENPTDIEGIIEFPIKCEYFDDGLRVIECDYRYEEILGQKLISINSINVDSIINDIGTLVSYDYGNEQKSSEYAKEYLNIYEFLKFFCIVDSYNANYVFEDDKGEKINITLKAMKNNNISYISENKKAMKISMIPDGESEVYWYQNFEEDNILFLKYSGFTSASSGEKYPSFYRFQDVLIKEINESNYEKLVIDLRDNKGGSLHILNSMIEMFKYSAKVDGENIYVVTSKNTGSAAVTLAWNLESEIGATIVGESTGGNINLFSTRNDQLELPNSKLKQVYSNKFIKNRDGYNGGVEPDIEVMQSYEDYIEGIDTCYEYIKNINKTE